MKRYMIALLVVACGLFIASAAMAGSAPGTGIVGSKHDLSSTFPTTNPQDNLNRICIYCHTPHHSYRLSSTYGVTGGSGPQAQSDLFDYLPLWNHTLQLDTSYQMYQPGPGAPTSGSKAPQVIYDVPMQPGSTSLLCLSCHDGTVAVNSYGNSDQLPESISAGNNTLNPPYQIGKDLYLGNHHPIGFDYDAVENLDTEIAPSATTNMGATGTTIKDHLLGPGNTQLECSSCHSVHNKGNLGETFLWISDQSSNLCLTCHLKGDISKP